MSTIGYTTAPTPPLSRNGESRRTRGAVIEYVISASFDGSEIYRCRGANPEFTVRITIMPGRARRLSRCVPAAVAPLEARSRRSLLYRRGPTVFASPLRADFRFERQSALELSEFVADRVTRYAVHATRRNRRCPRGKTFTLLRDEFLPETFA